MTNVVFTLFKTFIFENITLIGLIETAVIKITNEQNLLVISYFNDSGFYDVKEKKTCFKYWIPIFGQ